MLAYFFLSVFTFLSSENVVTHEKLFNQISFSKYLQVLLMATCDVFQFPFSTHVVQVGYLTLCNFFLQVFCFRDDTKNKERQSC